MTSYKELKERNPQALAAYIKADKKYQDSKKFDKADVGTLAVFNSVHVHSRRYFEERC